MKKKILLAFCVILFNNIYAQLYFKNNSNVPVLVSYAMKNNDKNDEAWYSYGWYSVDPNERVTLSSAVGLNSNVYWIAKSRNGNKIWDGANRDNSVSFLVSKKAFTIQNANLKYVKENNPEYYWGNFRHILIPILSTKYTIEIR